MSVALSRSIHFIHLQRSCGLFANQMQRSTKTQIRKEGKGERMTDSGRREWRERRMTLADLLLVASSEKSFYSLNTSLRPKVSSWSIKALVSQRLELECPLPGCILGIPTIVLPKGPFYYCLQNPMSDHGSENNLSQFKRRKSPLRLLHCSQSDEQ